MLGSADYPRQQALENPEAFATVINAIILDKYGEEAYDWDPLTIYLEIKEDFQVEISQEGLDKWSAMQVVIGSDVFFTRLDAFLNICNTLADGSPAFSAFNKVTSEEAAWAITEVAINRDMLPFSVAIKQYLRAVLTEDGYAEDNWPSVFDEVFTSKPSSKVIINSAADINETAIDEYVDGELSAMFAQFNNIPDLRSIDGLISGLSNNKVLDEI